MACSCFLRVCCAFACAWPPLGPRHRAESDPWALARACIDYGRLLEDAAAALPGVDRQSPADHTRRVQLLARAVLAYRAALAGGMPPPPPVKLGAGASATASGSSQTPGASSATVEERQDEARLYFALASAQFTLSEQFAPPPAPAAEAADEDADGGSDTNGPASPPKPQTAAPPAAAHSAASAPKAPTASAWWLALLDAPDLFAPTPPSASTSSKSASSAASSASASSAASGPLSADLVEAESAMTALIAGRLGTGAGGARLDPEAQAALLFAAERSMRVAASCALQVGEPIDAAEHTCIGVFCIFVNGDCCWFDVRRRVWSRALSAPSTFMIYPVSHLSTATTAGLRRPRANRRGALVARHAVRRTRQRVGYVCAHTHLLRLLVSCVPLTTSSQ